MSRVAVIVRIVFIFTWNTGPRLCLSINWCEKTSRGAALHSTQKRTQVTYWHLLNEWGPIFTEIPPLKYLWWEHIQYNDNTFYKKHIIQRQILVPKTFSVMPTSGCSKKKNATWTLQKWLWDTKDTWFCGCNAKEVKSRIGRRFCSASFFSPLSKICRSR